jgi:hypothetical protein
MLFGSSLDDAFTNRYPTIENFENNSNSNSNSNSQDMYKLMNDTFPNQDNNSQDESYASFNSKPNDSTKIEPPTLEPPTVEPPKIEPPKVEPPKVEPPKVEPPKVEEPTVEEPKVEEPKVNNELNKKIEQLEDSIKVINKKLNKLFDYVEHNNKINFLGKNIHDILLFIIFGIFVILLIEVMFSVFKMKLNKL